MIRIAHILDPLSGARAPLREAPFAYGATARTLAPERFNLDAPTATIARNGIALDRADWDRQLGAADFLTYVQRPTDPATTAFASVTWGSIYLTVGINLVGSFLLQALFGPDLPHVQPGDGSSSTYAFAGPSNVIGEGSVKPVILGEMRIAPPVIGWRTELINATTMRAHVAFLVSEGEVESFGGDETSIFYGVDTEELADGGGLVEEPLNGAFLDAIGLQVSGQKGSGVPGISALTRRGRLHQGVLPNFPETVLEYPVETEIPAPAVAVTPYTAGEFADGVGSGVAWSSSVTYTAGDEADRFSVRFAFPQGQYSIDQGDGGIDPNPVTVQLRYREVDDLGVPFGNFTVLEPITIQSTSVNPSFYEFAGTFSGSGYAPPAQGGYLALDGSNDYADKNAPTVPVQAADAVKITACAWVRASNNEGEDLGPPPIGPATSGAAIWSHFASDKGFKFYLAQDTVDTTKCKLRVVMGNGSDKELYATDPFPFAEVKDVYTFVGFTWEAAPASGTNPQGKGTLRLYVGNQLRKTIEINGAGSGGFRPLWASAGRFRVGTDDVATFWYLGGRVDHVSLWERALDVGEMLALATKVDKYGHPNGPTENDNGIWGLWKFDVDGTDATGRNNLTFNGGAAVAASGYVWTPEVLDPAKGKYLLEVIRLDVANSGTQKQDKTVLASVQLISDTQFQYPSRAILSVQYEGNDSLSGQIPLTTVLMRGIKCPVWDGVSAEFPNITWEWSANPAWVSLAVAVNKRWGMGNVYELADVDWPAFYEWAQHNDYKVHDGKEEIASTVISYLAGVATIQYTAPGPSQIKVGGFIAITDSASDWDTEAGLALTVLTKSEGATGTVTITAQWPADQAAPVDAAPVSFTVEGREVRCRCDLVLDRSDRLGWDELQKIMKTGRAVPVRLGRRLSVHCNQRKAQPDAVLTMANTKPGSFEISYSSNLDRYNSLDVEFVDRDQNYERRTATRNHPSLQNPALLVEVRKQQVSVEGVVRRSQIYRDADFKLAEYQSRLRTIRSRAGWDAVHPLPGDRVDFSHDVPQWGIGGRVWETSAAADEIALDRDMTFTFGSTYEITVRNSATDAIETVAIDASEIPGVGSTTVAAGTAIDLAAALSWVPSKDDVYSIGVTGLALRPYQAVGLRLMPDTLEREMVRLEYVDENYDLDDAFGVQQIETVLTDQAAGGGLDSLPAYVEGVTAVEETIRKADGSIEPGINVSWKFPVRGRGTADKVAVWVKRDGDAAPRHVADVQGALQQYRITNVPFGRATEYMVYAQTIGRNGARRELASSPQQSVTVWGQTPQPAAPTGAAVTLRGERAIYSATPPDEDGVPWLHAKVGGWILGNEIARWETNRPQSPAVDFWAYAPTNSAGETAPTIFFAAELQNGIISPYATTTFSAAPAGSAAALVQTSIEDSWSGGTAVLTNLIADTAYSPPALKWNGATSSATYESTDYDLGSAQRVYVSAFTVAYQMHPALPSALDYLPDSLEMQRWTPEGPTWLKTGESRVSLVIEWSYSATSGSPGTDWRKFEPGSVFMRSCRFRLVARRGDTTLDLRIRRFCLTILPVLGQVPGSSVVDLRPMDAETVGTSSSFARADHKHEIVDFKSHFGW